jgi:hypothetical protein
MYNDLIECDIAVIRQLELQSMFEVEAVAETGRGCADVVGDL